MTQLLQALINGLTDGAFLAMIALGITLIFGIARFPNVAHGDFLTVGAYGTYACVAMTAVPLALAGLVGVALSVALGVASYYFVFRPIGDRPVTALLASIGLSIFLRGGITLFAGPQQVAYEVPLWRSWKILGVRVLPTEVMICAASFLVIFCVHLILRHTRIGVEMRAVSDNAVLARTSGISAQRVNLATWMLALGVAGVAGIFLGIRTSIYPDMGWVLLLPAFSAAVLGGLGSPYGAILAGLLIGVGQNIATIWIDNTYKVAFTFIILIAVLLIKPTGLSGKREVAR